MGTRPRSAPYRGDAPGHYQWGGAGGHGRPPSVDEGFGQNRRGPVGLWRPVPSPATARAGLASARVARSRSAAVRAAGTVTRVEMRFVFCLLLRWGATLQRNHRENSPACGVRARCTVCGFAPSVTRGVATRLDRLHDAGLPRTKWRSHDMVATVRSRRYNPRAPWEAAQRPANRAPASSARRQR